MKEGVLRMIKEEEEDASSSIKSSTQVDSSSDKGSTLSDYFAFALSCATGAPSHMAPMSDSSMSSMSSTDMQWNPNMNASSSHSTNKSLRPSTQQSPKR